MTTNQIEKLVDAYSKKPLIRSLLQLIPGWSIADTLLQTRVDQIRSDRLRTFFQELADGDRLLTEDVVATEDFLHCYFSTVRAALNTRNREKIRDFARLLAGSLDPDQNVSTDEYEELLAVLEATSAREFAALLSLRKLENAYPIQAGENHVQNTGNYWEEYCANIETDLGLPAPTVPTFLAKMERTGLYLRITGAYYDYSGDRGTTTALFTRLLEFVWERNNAQQ